MRSQLKVSLIISGNKDLSAFEKKVYKAALAIPAGQVRSYAWVAARIGCPGAARAVGNALNKNPYAPLVPCHRVVRSDGSLGGFASGVAAKRRLLKWEGIDVGRVRLL